jgi:hypothetical protein
MPAGCAGDHHREKRLLEDAASFAKEVTSLNEEGFIRRTLAVLGIPATDSDTTSEQETETPEARPRPAAGPGRGRRF